MAGTVAVDLTTEHRQTAIERLRAAWRAQHPDAGDDPLPALLRAAEDAEERPSRDYLAALWGKLKDLVGADKLSREDFDAAHRSAMSSAGGKATARKRKEQAASEAADPNQFAEPGEGFLVALWLAPSTAERLAVVGGESATALHCTLCYCGAVEDLDDLTLARAIATVEREASWRSPLEGQVAGYGRFNASPTSDAQDVFYASVDVPGLAELREALVASLTYAGCPPRTTHGYVPHITLAYLDPDAPNPVEEVPSISLRFSAVTIMAGPRRIDVPLGGFAPMLYSTAARGAPWRLFVEQQRYADVPEWINVLPVPGTYSHPLYGTIAITPERNQRFVSNFEARVYQQDLPIALDIEHDGKMSGAVGYIETLRINADGSVDAQVAWTDRGRELVEGDAFRYFSPEWFDVWREPASGDVYEDVLIGGAICTRPFFKENALRPLVASEGRLYAPESPDGGEPVLLRQLAPTKEVPVEKDTDPTIVQLTEAEVQRFRELQARDAEREKAFADLQAKLTAQEEAKAASDERVARLEAEARTKRFTDLVMGRGGDGDGAVWPGAIDANVADLVALAEAVGEDSETFTRHVARMQETARTLAESDAFKPLGSRETSEGATALAEVRSLAEAKRKEAPALTIEQAERQVYAERTDLYERVLRGE